MGDKHLVLTEDTIHFYENTQINSSITCDASGITISPSDGSTTTVDGDLVVNGTISEGGTSLDAKYAALAGSDAQDFSCKDLTASEKLTIVGQGTSSEPNILTIVGHGTSSEPNIQVYYYEASDAGQNRIRMRLHNDNSYNPWYFTEIQPPTQDNERCIYVFNNNNSSGNKVAFQVNSDGTLFTGATDDDGNDPNFKVDSTGNIDCKDLTASGDVVGNSITVGTATDTDYKFLIKDTGYLKFGSSILRLEDSDSASNKTILNGGSGATDPIIIQRGGSDVFRVNNDGSVEASGTVETSGNLTASGAVTGGSITASGAVTGGSITDGTATLASGLFSNLNNIRIDYITSNYPAPLEIIHRVFTNPPSGRASIFIHSFQTSHFIQCNYSTSGVTSPGNATGRFHVTYSGGVYSNNSLLSSDDRMKHFENPIVNALDTVNKLKPTHYFKSIDIFEEELTSLEGIDGNYESGYIAQEVRDISELAFTVSGSEYNTDEDGNEYASPLRLDYNSIQPYLCKAIQELDVKNKALEATIENQQTSIESLQSMVENLQSQVQSLLAT